ncbi:MAG: hypothetical protein J6A74_03035 [Oscillospiraceae bacterium]|nr:hypothetical protein [Oscillospiraceae bacterium]
MKGYEEMTRSVLQRAREEKKARDQRRIKLMLATGCACLVVLAVFTGGLLRGPSDAKAPWQPRMSVLCVTASASQQRQPMMKGEQIPIGAQLFVHDIEGLSSQEVLQLGIADQEYAKQMFEARKEELTWGPDWATTSWSSEKTIVTTIFAGSFMLALEDYQQVKNVSVTSTEMGYTSQYGTDLYDTTQKDAVGFTWSLSQAGLKMLEENSRMPLSGIKDTVTVTVEFTDGTKEVAVVDISLDDDGRIYGTFREIYLA